MSVKTFSLTVLLLLSIAVAACAPAPASPAGSMAAAPTAVVMKEAMPTADTMMGTTPTADAMMGATPTDDMMGAKPTADAMMGATPTADMMGAMPTADTMMGTTPTADAMMGATPTDDMMGAMPTVDAMMGTTPTADSMGMPVTGGMGQKMAANPSWFNLALTDVRTGENFTIADFSGKVVLLEDMATWCPNCLEQQKQVKAMLQQMGMMNDLVVIGLGVDLNENAALLKSYADQNGFDWKYAVATPEVARQISTLYGAQFLNPTPTPMMVIDRRGNVFLQDFGIKSADMLQKALEPHLSMN